MKKSIAVLLSVLLIIAIIPLMAYAKEPLSGQCGDNAYWVYDEATGTVTISGEGEIWNGPSDMYDSQMPVIGPRGLIADKLIIEEGITKSGKNSFIFCQRLKEVTLPSSLKEIGDYAFFSNFSLKKVNFSEGLEIIGEGAFNGCTVLEEAVLPSTVKEIGFLAFAQCVNLKKLVLNEGIEELESGAFLNAYSLEEFVIPSTVKSCDSFAEVIDLSAIKSVINNSETAVLFGEETFEEDTEFIKYEDKEIMFYCYSLYFTLVAEACEEYNGELIDGDSIFIDALRATDEKFGTNFEEIGNFEDVFEPVNEFPPYLTISCTETSAQHEQCAKYGIPHEIIGSACDDMCGIHDIYENEYIAPTCTENGYIGGKVCLECEKVFEVPEMILPEGHKPVTVPAAAPTCTEIGSTETVICDTCGMILNDAQIIPAAGHVDENNDGVCDTCGEQLAEGEPQTIVERVIAFVRSIIDRIVALFRKLFS